MPSRDNHDDGRSYRIHRDLLRRRDYLAAAAGVTLLSGCLGDDSDPADGNGDDSGNGDDTPGNGDDTPGNGDDTPGNGEFDPADLSDDVRTMARLGESNLPEDLNFNPYSQTTPGHTTDICHDMLACTPYKGEIVLRGLDDWNWDGDSGTLTKTLRDDLVYWNGDQFTAEDIFVRDEIDRLAAPDASAYESIEVVDDLTLEYVIEDPPSERLVRNVHLPGRARWYHDETWRPWLEQFQDASNSDERDQASADITEFTMTIDEFVEQGLGTGVYEITDWTETEILYEPVSHGNHRFSDDLEIDRFKMHVTEYGSARADQLFIDGSIDTHTAALEPEYEGQVPDYIENVVLWELMFSYHMMINQRNHEALKDYNVRRAMACVIDTSFVVTNFGETRSNPVQAHTGMDPASSEQYWGSDLENALDYSPQESNYERADYFLEQSGYTREDGAIYNPDDEELDDITFVTGADFLFQVPSETVSLQLQEYGFPIEYNAVPRSQKVQTINEDMGNWDLSMESHYAAGDKHASSFFAPLTSWGYRLAEDSAQLEGWLDEGLDRSPYTGREFRPEIPTELGAEDLSGDTKEVNVYENYLESRRTDDSDRVDELVWDLSRMHNFHVPTIDVLHLISGMVGNTRDYSWPDDETLISHVPNAPYRLVHDGTITYSDEVK